MGEFRRLAKTGVTGLGLLVYLWFAGVHYAAGVRAKKETRRLRRRSA